MVDLLLKEHKRLLLEKTDLQKKLQPQNEIEKWFVDQCKGMSPLEILNWYRNLYHTAASGTERQIMAEAINDVFMEYKDAFVNKSSI